MHALVLGIGLRLIFLVSTPQLSGDVFRYLFDGRTLIHGTNPYTVLPDDPQVNHREIPTIYPPHAEIVFALAHQLTSWRLLLLACDVAAMFLLRDRAFAYATFPPLIFEGAWGAHVEIIAALLLLIATLYDSGSAFAASVGMKVIPIAALPAMILRSKGKRRFVIVFALALLIPALPFVLTGPLMPGMRDYATRWIFNSPAYDAALAIVDQIDFKRVFTTIKDPLHLEFIAPFVYRHLYSDFLARSLLALIAIVVITRLRRDSVASIGALLLCSPAIHPWYWLVIAPLAFDRNLWVLLALCAPASYLLYDGAPRTAVYGLCFVLPLLAASLQFMRRERAASSEQQAAPTA